jgi:hypothetical protein
MCLCRPAHGNLDIIFSGVSTEVHERMYLKLGCGDKECIQNVGGRPLGGRRRDGCCEDRLGKSEVDVSGS